MSQSPGSQVPTTRQKTAASLTRKTRAELEAADGLNTDIRSKNQAIAYLTAKEYLIPGKPADLQILSHVLLQFGINNKLPKPVTDGIRAVAFLMADTSAQQLADEVTTMIKTQIQEQMESFASNVEIMRDAVEHVTEAAKTITSKMEDFNDGFQESAEQLAQATHELTEKTAETTNKVTIADSQAPATYATIAQQQAHPDHAEIIAKGNNADRQILIQKDRNATDNALDNLTEKDLVTKANTALDLMGWEGMDKPRHTTFIGVKKLRNGSVLYQLNTEEAAAWLRDPNVQKSFMAHFGGTSNIRNKLYYVIAEFVPTSFDAGSSFAHTKLEEVNSMMEDSVAFSKYIKPPHLRSKNQKVAHVTMGILNRETANDIIQNGIFIEGKHVTVRKMLSEPRRCLKCQKFGHYVPDCKADKDTCARCGGPHRTSQCSCTDQEAFNCANCIGDAAKGHGAADRNCPKYASEKNKIQERIPENKYKFFPTQNPATWKLLNAPEPHSEHQQRGHRKDGEHNSHFTDTRHQNRFMEDWQTIQRQRGRPRAPQGQRQGASGVTRTGANEGAADNGWPTRPAQTTLENFFSNTNTYQPRNQEQTNTPNPMQNRTSRWGDPEPGEIPPGQGTNGSNAGREHSPLEYIDA